MSRLIEGRRDPTLTGGNTSETTIVNCSRDQPELVAIPRSLWVEILEALRSNSKMSKDVMNPRARYESCSTSGQDESQRR